MQDLVVSLQDNARKLRNVIEERRDVSIKRAKAEYLYRSELGKEMATAKIEGMAATALYDYCRGLDNIARLRAHRDMLQGQEDYLTELIYYYRTEIRIAEGMISAERKGV